jgi:hypothetical protein
MPTMPAPFPTEYLLGVSNGNPTMLQVARHNLGLIKCLPSGEYAFPGAQSLRDIPIEDLYTIEGGKFSNAITPRAANSILIAAHAKRLMADPNFRPNADALRP